MVYDFGNLTENNDVVNYGSTRSLSSSDAEFDLEDRPALIRGRMRGMPSPQTQRSRLRSVSASRASSASTVDHSGDAKSDIIIPEDLSALLTDNGYPSTYESKNTIISTAEIRIHTESCTNDAAPTAIGVTDSQDKNLSGSIHRWMKKKSSDKKSSWRNFDSPLRSTRKEETEDEQLDLAQTESPPKSPHQSSLSPMKSARRFWSNHVSEENTQSKVESADALSSPSKQKSAPSSFVSPMKLRSQRVLSTILGGRSQVLGVADNKHEQSLSRSEHLGDESPTKKGSVSSSLSQRTFGTVLRGWQQSKDNKIDQHSPDTTNTDSISINHLVQPTLSPTRRAVSGILRVRSCHDRSTRTNKSPDVVDNGEAMHKSQSVHVRTTYHSKDATNEANCVQLNIEELVRGETVMCSNSERGTRSSIPIPDNDMDETVHSRTVRSLVSPRQQKSRKLRVSSARTLDKDTKSRRRRSGSGSVVSSSRSTRSVGEKSRSSSRSRNRLQQQVSQSELRSKSMPRSRDSMSVSHSDGNLRSRSRSQGRPESIDDDNKSYENGKRLREAIRSGQSDNTPKTPKLNQVKDNGEVRTSTKHSRRQDEMKSPRSRKEMDRSIRNSKRILSDGHNAALDRPKTPRSAKSRSNDRGEGARKISRDDLRDLESPVLDDTKTSTSTSNSKSEHSTQKRSISRQRRVSRGLSENGTNIGEPNRSGNPSEVTSNVSGKGGNDVRKSDASTLNRSSSTRRSSISSRSSRNDPKSPGSSIVARSSHSFSQRTPSRRRTSLSDRAQSARDLKRKIKSDLDNDTHKATSQSDFGRNTNTNTKSTESSPNVDSSKRMIDEKNRVNRKPSASGSNRFTNDEKQSVYVCD